MKRKFLLTALFFVIITKTIFSQGVDIKVNCPSNVQQGQEFEIKITITKGDISGFARLQLDFPEGFNVKTSQALGSTFSFKENKARFLWMSLPGDNVLTVNCMVTAAAPLTGKQEFEGAFSCVINNETQKTPIAKQSLTIDGAAGLVAQKETKTENTEAVNKTGDKSTEDAEKLESERKAREVAIAKADKEKKERDEQEKRLKEEAAQKAREDALAQEEAEKNANKNKEVKNVDNNNKDNEKIEQEKKAKEEADAIAEEQRLAKQKEAEKIEQEKKTKESNNTVSDEDKAAKQKEVEKIEQERKAKEDAIAAAEKEKKARDAEEARLAQIQKEEGVKTEESSNKVVDNKVTDNKVSDNNVADNKDNAEKLEMEKKAKEEAKAKFEAERAAKEEADRIEREKYAKEMALKAKETENKKAENKTEIAKNNTEKKTEIKTENKAVNSNINKASVNGKVDFRVQVGASRKVADHGDYTKLNKGMSDFKVVQNDGADGWYRYTIGSFNDVNGAQNLLPKVKQLGYNGFVVAFKDGKRITIQEAKKMIGQ